MSDWTDQVADLLAGVAPKATRSRRKPGAQLTITAADGTVLLAAPLARHMRIDGEAPDILWIRPVHAGGATGDPDVPYAFNLSRARPVGLSVVRGEAGPDGAVVLELHGPADGGAPVARIEPAAGSALQELQRWDSFVASLSAEDRAALDALDSDSWHGAYG